MSRVDTQDLITIRDFLRYATSRFQQAGLYFGHGTDNAWDEALLLILPSLHLPMDNNIHFLDAKLTPTERQLLLQLIQQRIDERIPVAYLTHQAWLGSLSFYVDKRVLIPRSPMIELIEHGFQPWLIADEIHHILELCTGSGCIAIACAKAMPHATIDATDISTDALDVAKINLSQHQVDSQVTLYQSDLWNTVPDKKYDLIIGNPPYVSKEEVEHLPAEYHHEPVNALLAGHDGLLLIDEILAKAADYLTEHGTLIIEVGNSEEALIERYPEAPFTWLQFERGGHGVFLLSAHELREFQHLWTC